MRTQHHRFVAAAGTIVIALAATACGASTPTPPGSAPNAAGPSAVASPAGPSTQPAVAAGDWAGFRGDPSRTGVATRGPVGNPVLNWQFKAGGAVPNNIAIVGDTVYFASDDAVVHAISRGSGAEAWKVQLVTPTVRGPVGADGRLYLADEADHVLALDPANRGSQLWQSATTYGGVTEMLSVGGSLYFGTDDGYLVALDPATGAEQWKLKLTPSGAAVHNPAYADGRVFAGTAGGGFVAVDVASHAVAWTGDLGGDDTGTASAANGIAYIATPADATNGRLRAFDATTGKALWTGPSPLLTTPNVVDGVAYSSTMQGLVDAIDTSTGALRWSIQLSGKIRPMAVVGTTLFLSADTEQRVYAIETATGNKLWQFDVDGPSDCCIAVAKGAVFVGTLTGSVYSIGGDGATIAAVPIASAAASAAPTSAAVTRLDVKTSWSTDLRDLGIAPIGQIAVDPNGRIWAPAAAADDLVILDPGGKVVDHWGSSGSAPGEFDFTRSNGDGYGTLAFAKDGSFFVLDVGNRRVQHFDAKRKLINTWGGFGSDAGKYGDPVGIAVAPDGTVWVIDDQRDVAEHYRPDGTVIGSFDPFSNMTTNDGSNGLSLDRDGNLYVSQIEPNQISEFDPSGKLIRTVGDPAVFTGQPSFIAIDGEGRLFVTMGNIDPAVTVFDHDGTVLGAFGDVYPKGDLAFPAGIALDGKGGLYLEDMWPDTARMIRYELPAELR